jgi:hypothetical protein
MEYKRRRVSSALDNDIELGKIEIKNEKNSNINTFKYYEFIFREFRKLMCCCRHNNCENDYV